MAGFLAGHYRYHTLNSWNNSTSYAHCVKISKLGLTQKQRDTAYDLVGAEDTYDVINSLMHEFAYNHKNEWQMGFNGRSGGHIVLYQGNVAGSCYPGRGTDDTHAVFYDWSVNSLRSRVKLVCEFDRAVDMIRDEFIHLCDDFEVVTETVMVPKQIRVLKEKRADG